MKQCLTVLLFHECSALLERYGEAEWAATQAIWMEKRREMHEHAEWYREMIEEGWFSDTS